MSVEEIAPNVSNIIEVATMMQLTTYFRSIDHSESMATYLEVRTTEKRKSELSAGRKLVLQNNMSSLHCLRRAQACMSLRDNLSLSEVHMSPLSDQHFAAYVGID
jgi:hypothetical protein